MNLAFQSMKVISLKKIEFFLMRFLIFDIIFLGPMGIKIWGSISERHLLLGLSFAFSVIFLLKRKSFSLIAIYPLLGAVFYFLIWGFIIPLLKQGNFSSSVEEIKPVIYFLFIFSALRLRNTSRIETIRKDLILWSAILGVIVVTLWFKANFSLETGYAYALKLFYSILGGTSDGLYIGPMPDGSFRIFWISCAIFPWSILLLKRSDKLYFLASIFFLVAAFATGTRAVFYCAVIAFVVNFITLASLKTKLVGFSACVVLIVVVLSYGLGVTETSRIFDIQSVLKPDSARYIQAMSLLESLEGSEIFGSGFGASATVVRSESASFSYELTYIALLMKTGLLGIIYVTGLLYLIHYSINNSIRHRMIKVSSNSSVYVSLLFFFMLTFTNPYLFTIHGLTLFVCLIVAASNKFFAHANNKNRNDLAHRAF